MTLQAITVQQPWAWAIAAGHKPIENRTRNQWRVGEDLAVHAGGRWSRRGAHDLRVIDAVLGEGLDAATSAYADLERARVDLARRGLSRLPAHRFVPGAVLAIAHLVDAHPDEDCCRPWGESLFVEAGGRVRTEVVHLVLADVRALPHPRPWPGQLGAWKIPTDAERAIRDQLDSVPT